MSDILKKKNEKGTAARSDPEKEFFDKVQAELALPEYNIFSETATPA